jgi:hypothetical protein
VDVGAPVQALDGGHDVGGRNVRRQGDGLVIQPRLGAGAGLVADVDRRRGVISGHDDGEPRDDSPGADGRPRRRRFLAQRAADRRAVDMGRHPRE